MRAPSDQSASGTPNSLGSPASSASILRSRLFIKYLALLVAMVSLALIANGAFDIFFSYNEQKASLVRIQREQAAAAAGKIGQFITEIESQVGWTTQLPWSASTLEQRRFDALRLLRQVPAITELAEIDSSGHEQLKVSRLAMEVVGSGNDVSKDPAFTEAVAHKVYYGPVYFRRESEPYMTLSLAGTRRDTGVSIAQVNLKLIWDVLSKIKFAGHGRAYVVDATGRLIAHPDISLVLRNTDMSQLAQVKSARAGAAGNAAEPVQEAADIDGHKVLTASALVAPLGWHVFVETPIEEAYAPLYAAIERTALVLLGALALAFAAGMFLARRMVVPIQVLRTGAARLGSGDLGQRIAIKTGDEVEALADQFNDMAGRLQESYADLEHKVDVRTRELTESLEQQTATSEVLQVISSSPGDLKPVFAAMLENAARICGANFGNIFRWEDDALHLVASHNLPPAYAKIRGSAPFRPPPESPTARMIEIKSVTQVADLAAEQAYAERDPTFVEGVEIGGIRTLLSVPMLKEDKLVGAFTLYRQEVRPFTDKQVALVSNFANQAVIAIENARLLTELRQRTDDLTESLEQQTATSEVLRVISSSPGNLEPVFASMLEKAVAICEAKFGNIYRWDGDALHLVATYNTPPAFAEARRYSALERPGALTVTGRMLAAKAVVHVADAAEQPGYADKSDPAAVAAVELGGTRTILAVPMTKEGELIGSFTVYRQEVRPFADKQIALLEGFAAQAVIAIENTRLLTELRQRTDDLTQSLEQQTATADVLGVISRSKFELQPILQSVVDTAARLCRAEQAVIFRLEDGLYHFASGHGVNPAYLDIERQNPIVPGQGTVVGRAATNKAVVRIDDAWSDPLYEKKEEAKTGGVRSMIGVPLMREDEPIGVIALARGRVEPFADREINLVSTFADQAVIAIENVRLFEAEQQRTAELTESLEQQTATADVLRVISSSPGDLQPVFSTMLENAVRICDAKFGNIYQWDGELLHLAAAHNTPPALAELRRQTAIRPSGGMLRMIETKMPVHYADLAASDPYKDGDPAALSAVEVGGVRAFLTVPMIKEDELMGSFSLYRQEARPFTDKQIEVVTSFAAQAVIAIENARLLAELRQRTDDLTESLEQQTATSEVLQVISSSPGDLEPVFAALLEKAVRLCGAKFGNLHLREGEAFRTVAMHNAPAAYVEARLHELVHPAPYTALAEATRTKRAVQVEDVKAGPAYRARDSFVVSGVELAGIRTMLVVPMLKDDELVGSINIYRQEVLPFDQKQIDIVSNFAAQAVIAVENARLVNELRQRTDDLGRSVGELRALGEVSQAVNSTLELETVLDTIVAKAVQLSNTDAGAIYVYGEQDREFHLRATFGMDQKLIDALSRARLGVGDRNLSPMLTQRQPVQVADLSQEVRSPVDDIILSAGYRARLVAPLFRGDDIVGMLVVRRRAPGAFAPSTVDLMKTFAAQSAVTIHNARLYESVETRTRELAASLQDLRTAQDRLVQTEKLASLGQLTAGIAHEIKNPLNFVNNFSSVSVELIDELQDTLRTIIIDDKTRTDITEVSDMLRGNLEKVVQHGKRADSIVKNMLLHSRQGSGEHQPVDINALVEESLNLAYHGARAEKQGFNITLLRSLDPTAGQVDLFPQEITRVLLNLISNGFYAATKRKGESGGSEREPILSASTKNLGDSVEIRIRDNGAGIPPEVKEKMFNPFFTTKPAGEGTGLGLSLSHDIIVKQHAGSIEVDTKTGEFTEFRIVLPRAAAAVAKSGGNA
jgi:GAF domain-containing protein/signal transduction histidine kinase